MSTATAPSPSQMPSKSSDSNSPRPRRGFTLLELLIIVALLGLVIGLVAPGAARMLAGGAERTRRAELIQFLLARRLDALQDARRVDIAIEWSPQTGLRASSPQRDRRWSDWPAPLASDPGAAPTGRPATVRIAFDPDGRADRREIRFGAPESDTMWAVVFDAVSGLPRVEEGAGDRRNAGAQ